MPPLLYLGLMVGFVALGVPGGVLVIGAGVLYGLSMGLWLVVFGQILGMLLNWRLYRGVLRPRVERWLMRQQQGRWSWMLRLQQAEPGMGVLLLLRLTAIPMTLVNASCALGVTPPRTYALSSLMLVPRYGLLLLAGGSAADASRGSLSILDAAVRVLGLLATAVLLGLVAGRVLRRLRPHS